jgi:hypothetical protein
LEEVEQSNPVGLTGRKTPLTLKQNTQLSELIQARSLQEALEESDSGNVRSELRDSDLV